MPGSPQNRNPTPRLRCEFGTKSTQLDFGLVQIRIHSILVSMSPALPRLYDAIAARHLAEYRQMVFLSGPRQVGKTTTARRMADYYLNWDNPAHRKLIMEGPDVSATNSSARWISSSFETRIPGFLSK